MRLIFRKPLLRKPTKIWSFIGILGAKQIQSIIEKVDLLLLCRQICGADSSKSSHCSRILRKEYPMRSKNSLFKSFIITLCLFFTQQLCAEEVSKIAALINDRVILASDLDNRIKLAILSSGIEDNEKTRAQLKEQILKQMIEEQIQLDVADKFHIPFNAATLDIAVSDIEQRNNMKPGQLSQMLAEQNIPIEAMHVSIQSGIQWNEYIRGKYQDAIQISPDLIQREVEKRKQSKEKPHVLLGEIRLSFEDSGSENKANEQAWRLAEEIKRGAPFSAVAGQFSSSASAARGGDVGWVPEDQLDEQIRTTIENTIPGEVTNPIRLENEYVIFMVREKRGAGESLDKQTLVSFYQVLFPLSPMASPDRVNEVGMRAVSLGQSAKSAAVFKQLTSNTPGIQFKEFNNINMQALNPDMQGLLNKLPVGQASQPLRTEAGMIMFMISDKTENDPSEMTEEQIKAYLIDQKLGSLSAREMKRFRNTFNIEIRV